ncbi:amidase family protein [Bradyrhizobium sp. B117]|uniref:amidase family protein n=1 Tax=Bradyrhizobium sp. B117 TaxID=3140246 RepID=UPI00318421A1
MEEALAEADALVRRTEEGEALPLLGVPFGIEDNIDVENMPTTAIIALNPIDVLILSNHGLVVGAADCDEAEAQVHEVEERLSLAPRRPSAVDDQALRSICSGTDYRLPANPLCHSIATGRISCAIADKRLAVPGPRRFFRTGSTNIGGRPGPDCHDNACQRTGGN